FGPCEDETMDLGVVKLGENIKDLEHHASHLMVIEDKEEVKQEGTFTAQPDYLYTLEMNPEHGHINFVIEEDGEYALVLEHDPSESNMQVFDKDEVEVLPKQEIKGHGHDH
ncbi:MAG: hypothetical protein Q4Q07_02925, partial [Tissierellia bacterium]|nr:hypothetical protein [Tissierellia bacterium]